MGATFFPILYIKLILEHWAFIHKACEHSLQISKIEQGESPRYRQGWESVWVTKLQIFWRQLSPKKRKMYVSPGFSGYCPNTCGRGIKERTGNAAMAPLRLLHQKSLRGAGSLPQQLSCLCSLTARASLYQHPNLLLLWFPVCFIAITVTSICCAFFFSVPCCVLDTYTFSNKLWGRAYILLKIVLYERVKPKILKPTSQTHSFHL